MSCPRRLAFSMSKSKLKIISAIPNARTFKGILADFAKGGEGLVSSLSDIRLKPLGSLVETGDLTVEPFGSVAGQFLVLARGRMTPLAQQGHVRAAISETCLALTEDSPFFRARRFPGAHSKIDTALDELRDWGLVADALPDIAEKCSQGLRSKILSLASIEREVSDSLQRIGRERIADRIAAALCLETEPTDMGRLLLFVGSELPPIYEAWICWAVARGAEITAVLDAANSESGLFSRAANAIERLGAKGFRAGRETPLLASLFVGADLEASPSGEGNPVVEISSSADPLAEAEWVIRSVAAELAAGTSADRIAIYCRDAEGYLPLLSASAVRFGVPITTSRRQPLLGNSLTRLTLDVIDFCAGDDVRLLASVLRSSYLCLAPELIEKGILAVREAYRQGDGQWQALEGFSRAEETDYPWLTRLLEWRRAGAAENVSLAHWCERLRDLGAQPWNEEAVNRESVTGTRDSYAQTALQRSLAQYATVERARAARRLSLKGFADMARAIWEDAEVSSPTVNGAVRVLSMAAQIGNVDSIYVMGMLEGVFPRRRSEDPILTDADRAELSGLLPALPPLPDSRTKAVAEREEFYRLCAAPARRLAFSYPQTGEDRDNVRAFYLLEVERAMKGEISYRDHKRTELTPAEPAAKADIRLAASLAGPRIKPAANVLQDAEARLLVRDAMRAPMEARHLADALECGFHYLAEHNLGLRPNRRRSRWGYLFGLPKIANLAAVPFREAAEKALGFALENELADLAADASAYDLALLRSGGERLNREWLEREFRSRDLWPRDSVTEAPRFGEHLRGQLKADEGFVQLKGTLPALSERNGYRILHLFKASDPWDETVSREDEPWSRLKLKEAFELGLYLRSLYGVSPKTGIEIDCASGSRELFLLPRPAEPVMNHAAKGFRVTFIDNDLRKAIFKSTNDNILKALRRISGPEVEACPGSHCSVCEYGELCRRSRDFGEVEDPFASEER